MNLHVAEHRVYLCMDQRGMALFALSISTRKAAMLLSGLKDDMSEKQEKEMQVSLAHCPKAATLHPLVL